MDVAQQMWRASRHPNLKMMLSPDEAFPEGAIHQYRRGPGRRGSTYTLKSEKIDMMKTDHGKKLAMVVAGAFTRSSVESENAWTKGSPRAGPEFSQKEIDKLRATVLNLGCCASLLTRRRDNGGTANANIVRAGMPSPGSPKQVSPFPRTTSGTTTASVASSVAARGSRRRQSLSPEPGKVLEKLEGICDEGDMALPAWKRERGLQIRATHRAALAALSPRSSLAALSPRASALSPRASASPRAWENLTRTASSPRAWGRPPRTASDTSARSDGGTPLSPRGPLWGQALTPAASPQPPPLAAVSPQPPPPAAAPRPSRPEMITTNFTEEEEQRAGTAFDGWRERADQKRAKRALGTGGDLDAEMKEGLVEAGQYLLLWRTVTIEAKERRGGRARTVKVRTPRFTEMSKERGYRRGSMPEAIASHVHIEAATGLAAFEPGQGSDCPLAELMQYYKTMKSRVPIAVDSLQRPRTSANAFTRLLQEREGAARRFSTPSLAQPS